MKGAILAVLVATLAAAGAAMAHISAKDREEAQKPPVVAEKVEPTEARVNKKHESTGLPVHRSVSSAEWAWARSQAAYDTGG